MKALVTGGAGFIGSHLVDLLLSRGDKVMVLDDLSTGSRDNLRHHADNLRLQIIETDVRDAAAVDAAVSQVDCVFHLAARLGVRRVVEDPVATIQINEAGTMNVLAAAARTGAKTVLASSSEAYGKSIELPLEEQSGTLLGPSTISRWSYAVSKLAAEHLALGYFKQGLPVAVVRYFNVYGPRYDASGYGGVIARFLEEAITGRPLTVYGDGTQTRSFLYVAEAAAATLAAMDAQAATGQIMNIGHPMEVTIADLATLVADVSGSKSRIQQLPLEAAYGTAFEEVAHRRPDVSKAQRLVGFNPKVGLEEGLLKTVAWRETIKAA